MMSTTGQLIRAVTTSAIIGMLAGCGGGTKHGASEPQPPVVNKAETKKPDASPSDSPGMRLRVKPDTAEVLVDGRRIGLASEIAAKGGTIPLRPGIHRIVVRKKGHKTWRAEVVVRDKMETIQVNLEAIAKP